MSFREKSAWITLAITIGVYGLYLVIITPRLLAGGFGLADFILPLVGAVVLLIVIHVVLVSLAAMIDPAGAQAPHDERERSISLRADRAGFYTLQAGAFFAIVTILRWPDATIIANAVFLAMAAAEVARAGFTIADFRRVTL